MIKFIGALLMLIDHFGLLIFPTHVILRVIGRFAMPLFAYSVANGFKYTSLKSSETRYLKNMIIFSLVSQVPYNLIIGHGLNIGFTWVLSILLLMVLENLKSSRILIVPLLCLVAWFIPVEYGLYGVLFPIIFYYTVVKKYNFLTSLLAMSCLYIGYIATHGVSGAIQFFAILALYVILFLKRFDNVIKLHKWFYYVFYPTHIIILGILANIL